MKPYHFAVMVVALAVAYYLGSRFGAFWQGQ